MDEINFDLKDAAIAYLIASAPDSRFPCHTSVCGGSLTVSHTAATDVLTAEQDGRAAAVIGYCVDAHGELARYYNGVSDNEVHPACIERALKRDKLHRAGIVLERHIGHERIVSRRLLL